MWLVPNIQFCSFNYYYSCCYCRCKGCSWVEVCNVVLLSTNKPPVIVRVVPALNVLPNLFPNRLPAEIDVFKVFVVGSNEVVGFFTNKLFGSG